MGWENVGQPIKNSISMSQANKTPNKITMINPENGYIMLFKASVSV